ncbi:unnamed protein product [Microthlaspi erraticum]|uniref:Uncharacterized protein n=1 Tax=Microthlaspi erraticum TaxID=1685480 RepID=A0A6D2I746_9BRAS|nr:unnamed protein product [Microthlaspi erraticum]
MDFIKTSSLRALIELTFQRKWNGLIWMSRKGVIAKRVKTVQTALSRISAKPCRPAGRGTNVPRSAKVQPSVQARPITSRPGKHVPRSAKPQPLTTPRTTMPREPGSNPRGRATLTYHGRCAVRAGKDVPRPAEKHRPNLHPSDHSRPTTKHPATTVPTRRPDPMSGRPSRPTVRTSERSTRSRF